MGATQDLKLIDETLEYITTKVRDQDVVNVFSGLAENHKARRILIDYYKKNYDVVCLWGL
jgi:aminopeptidase 2